MTDKEVRAIAIKEITYADMIAIGATEEIATAASWKARCAFEASWDCAIEKAVKWIGSHLLSSWQGQYLDDFRKAMEE